MRDVRRIARLAVALVTLALPVGCISEKPVIEATGVPAGAGVNVPPGSNEDFIVNVGRRTYFAENSAELNEVAQVTLQKQAEWLTRYARYKIKIEGFADDRGSAETNKALGMKRADAVRAYLASLGVASDRMRTKTFGNAKERVVHDCNDASCRAQNRRVVTVLEQEGV